MGSWGLERRDGTVGMRAQGWEPGDVSVGMGAWVLERGDGSLETLAS